MTSYSPGHPALAISWSRRWAACSLALAIFLCCPQTSSAQQIRALKSQHLTLVTDVPSSPEVDALPELFDQAVPQWQAYFRVDPTETAKWHITAHLMQSRERFVTQGLIPDNLPKFLHGYSANENVYLYQQNSDYYRRHLLLHEGTHSFMFMLIPGAGPAWYVEGMAELLGTNRLRDGELTLNEYPQRRSLVPGLGRIRIIQDAYADKHAMTVAKIMGYDGGVYLENDPYAWSWALCALLDGHPRYRKRFRDLPRALGPDFNKTLREVYAKDWADLQDEWQVFIANIEHHYDFERMAIDFRPGKPLTEDAGKDKAAGKQPGKSRGVTIAADRGWQSSGVLVEAGKTYRLHASGRFQIAGKEQIIPWMSEAGGVTARYYKGQPLGLLLAAVHAEPASLASGPVKPEGATSGIAKLEGGASGTAKPEGGASGFVKPIAIGLDATLTPTQTGTLYLRVNESAGKLSGNRGELRLDVSAE